MKECRIIKTLTEHRFKSDFDNLFPHSLQGISDEFIDDILLLGISYLHDEKRQKACMEMYLERRTTNVSK